MRQLFYTYFPYGETELQRIEKAQVLQVVHGGVGKQCPRIPTYSLSISLFMVVGEMSPTGDRGGQEWGKKMYFTVRNIVPLQNWQSVLCPEQA